MERKHDTSEEKKWLEEPHGHPVYIYDEPELVEENKTLSFKEKGKKLSAISLLGNFFGMQKKVGKKNYSKKQRKDKSCLA